MPNNPPLAVTASAPPQTRFTGLLRAELDRYLRRRATWLGLLVALAASGLCAVLAGFDMAMVATTSFAALWAFIAAAASIGQDIGSGALGTWFSVHPRRLQVLVSRLLAIAIVTAAATLALLLVSSLVARASGADLPIELFAVVQLVSCLIAAVSGGLFGACLAALFGSTLTALGCLAGAQALSTVSSLLLGTLTTWGPTTAVSKLTVPPSSLTCETGDCVPQTLLAAITERLPQLLELLAWGGLVLALAAWRWRRRDIS